MRIKADYNRELALPIRLGHTAWHFAKKAVQPIWLWAGYRTRGRWAKPMLVAIPAAALVMPLDNFFSAIARHLNNRENAIHLGGDIRRMLDTLQEYGGLASLVLIGGAIWLLDTANRRRLADLVVAVAITGVTVPILKMIVGRPKPRPAVADLYDSGAFLGPFGAAPLGPELGVRHAWEFWVPDISVLQSMPSAHAASAAVLGVFLYSLYPRLKPLLILMGVVVGICRVLFTAHWASDVVIGAGVGMAIAQVVLAKGSRRGGWGCRLLDARQRSI